MGTRPPLEGSRTGEEAADMPDACFSVVPSEKGIERRNWLHSQRSLDLVAPTETSLCEMRSQARQQSVALKETTASRFVVAKRILNRGTCGMERVLSTKSRRHRSEERRV